MWTAFLQRRERFASVMAWTRERREMGFSLLYGNAEAASLQDHLRGRMQLHYRIAAGLPALLLVGAGLLAGWAAYWQAAVHPANTACFSCMFDSLQNWWDLLSNREKGAIVLGAFALALLFVGFWPARRRTGQ